MKPITRKILISLAVLTAFVFGLVMPNAIYAVADIAVVNDPVDSSEQIGLRPCLRPSRQEPTGSGDYRELFTVSCINRSL